MKRAILIFVAIIVINLLLPFEYVYSQCAMCKQNVTSSDEGMKLASGLNDGIVYLLVVPYLIFAGFAIAIYVSSKRKKKTFYLN
ncbi:MAG: hypothetical protein RMJ81_07440 [Candidatus Kryptonium sp.]|nr:hypothetical protein [Candidatus Kryptonium sp.]MCX7762864.1 hypothetical protein [Candidatus Kryptonium sp.]MDW8109468.1 hypothetical protein [Candidatus Kryptonium sp.]